MGQKYLSIEQSGSFGFKDSDINQVLETDVPIYDDVYNQFFEQQSQGRQFHIGDINGTTFEEIFVEFIPELVPQPPSLEDRLSATEAAISALMEV
jgi:hypothetical protein